MKPDENSFEQRGPEPDEILPGPPPETIGREETVDKRELAKKRSRQRASDIKFLAKYYHLSYAVAQQKYYDMKANSEVELNEVLDKARDGLVADAPVCPQCSANMVVRDGKFGQFWSCERYPNCRGTRPIKSEIVKVTDEQKQAVKGKLDAALEYIDKVGGFDEALKYLQVAAMSLGKTKSEAVKTESRAT